MARSMPVTTEVSVIGETALSNYFDAYEDWDSEEVEDCRACYGTGMDRDEIYECETCGGEGVIHLV